MGKKYHKYACVFLIPYVYNIKFNSLLKALLGGWLNIKVKCI